MASSLKELIEEWENQVDELDAQFKGTSRRNIAIAETLCECISDLRDTLLVMEAEEVRRGAVPK